MANTLNRRGFLKAGTLVTAASYIENGIKTHLMAEAPGEPARSYAANDQIQVALIGAGGMGQGDTRTAAQVPGVKVVAAADCYDGRLAHSKELWGADCFTTRDYHEILNRKDVDAVIIATPDHWHKTIAVDSMNAGKDVYLEKPMIHVYSDGPEIIAAAQKTQRILQVGSQRVSSMLYKKAHELVQSGAIGQITSITAWWDRNSSIGAWNYTIPPDASTQTIDWERFLGSAPQIPFNAEHFFQWRKWKVYGTGVAGDLFVHLFSGTHFVTASHGPTRAMATGGLRFWKDGRDANDVVLGLFDYPQGFNLNLRVNFCAGGPESEGFVVTGSEGTLQIGKGSRWSAFRARRSRAFSSTRSPTTCRRESRRNTGRSIPSRTLPASLMPRMRNTPRRRDTTTGTITSRSSSKRCERVNQWWKTRSSVTARRVRLYWLTPAWKAERSCTGIRRR